MFRSTLTGASHVGSMVISLARIVNQYVISSVKNEDLLISMLTRVFNPHQVYYIRAHFMCVLPTFQPLPEDGIVKVVLKRALNIITDAAASPPPINTDVEKASMAVLEAILEKSSIASREYFGRGWTLAERMGRHQREEKLCHWISLEAWLGMLVDAMIKGELGKASC